MWLILRKLLLLFLILFQLNSFSQDTIISGYVFSYISTINDKYITGQSAHVYTANLSKELYCFVDYMKKDTVIVLIQEFSNEFYFDFDNGFYYKYIDSVDSRLAIYKASLIGQFYSPIDSLKLINSKYTYSGFYAPITFDGNLDYVPVSLYDNVKLFKYKKVLKVEQITKEEAYSLNLYNPKKIKKFKIIKKGRYVKQKNKQNECDVVFRILSCWQFL